MIDPQLFGLPQDVTVEFFTPEQSAKRPGSSSGYNAVYTTGKRVRYELLKSGKVSPVGGAPVAPVVVPVPEVPVAEPVIEPVPAESVVTPVTEEVPEEAAKPSKKKQNG